jgi:ribonuclease HI
MPKRRKKKIVRVIHPSPGPLPAKLAPLFAERLLLFSDASQKRHGGLAAVFFTTPESEAQVRTRTVALAGSNELELQAALFALEQARQLFPGRELALFSDNHDAVLRLNRARTLGLDHDTELGQMAGSRHLAETLANASINWIKGHGSCRGNILADQHAAEAAA